MGVASKIYVDPEHLFFITDITKKNLPKQE